MAIDLHAAIRYLVASLSLFAIQHGEVFENPAVSSIHQFRHEYLTLRDAARLLGSSYHFAYTMSVGGSFGEPLVLADTHFYPRAAVAAAERARRNQKASIAPVAVRS